MKFLCRKYIKNWKYTGILGNNAKWFFGLSENILDDSVELADENLELQSKINQLKYSAANLTVSIKEYEDFVSSKNV